MEPQQLITTGTRTRADFPNAWPQAELPVPGVAAHLDDAGGELQLPAVQGIYI